MRLAPRTPAACSACYGQYTDRRHVDFDAAWDGPVLDGSVKVAIDDLVICENCLTTAGALIGLKNPELELRSVLARLELAEQRAADAEMRIEAYRHAMLQLDSSPPAPQPAPTPAPPKKARQKVAA